MRKTFAALTAVMVTCMFAPVTALDAYAEEWTEVHTWADLAAALNAGSQVKLMQNVSKSADYLTVDTGKTSVLDLNGHTIERLQETSVSYGFVIYVHGGDLTIMDSSAQQTGKITGGFVSGKGGGGVSVDSGGHLTLAGGSITGNKSDYRGGGVYIDDESCTFTMTGGSITNNTVINGDGGGVFVGNFDNNANFSDGSCFIMSGGTISGNTANQGGGVYIKSFERDSSPIIHSFNTFQMSGGTITGNTATSTCGGVYLSGSGTVFTMTGGSLTGNTASSLAGGIYVTAGTQMNIGGLVTIDGNTAADVANNVRLAAGRYLNITEPLDAASSIGVSSVSAPTSSRQVQITSNLNGANYSVFSSDNEDYYVEVKEDGEAYLFLEAVFNISVTAPAHGTLSANMSTSRPGKTVTLTVAADPTYRVDHVYFKPDRLDEQEISPVDGIYSFPMPTRDVTVRAVFAAIPLSVGLDPGEGGGTASSTQVFPADGTYTYTLPDNPYTAPENMFFDGWSLNGNRYQPGDAVTLTEDCVFTAQWNSAAVHFDANGGSGFMADEFCGTSYTLPACGFLAPDRHCFTGWLVGDAICQPGAVITVEGDTTITAQWDLAYTISSSSVTGGCTFTVTRKDASEAATIKYRTVNQSAIAGVHYRAATGTLTFGAGEYSLTTPTIELLSPGGSTIDAYYKSGSTKRSFGFEVFDPGSYQRLASYTRSIDFNTSYKVPASGTYAEKTVTVKSGETTITDDGYDSNSPISYSMSGYYSQAAPKEYLQLSGAQLRMVIWFDAKEDDDGYQYLSILTNTSDYDNRTECSNGDPGNLSKSLYMMGFEHDSGDENTTYARYSMPLTAYGNCGAVTAPWAHTIGDLTAQKFKSGCRAADDGRLIFPLSASTLAIRGNASGKDDDDWVIKNISAKIQAVDTAAPTVGNTYATSGTHGYGDTVTIAVRFSEIVNVTGSPTLNTNFGTAAYKGGSGTCVLYFTVPLDQNSTAGSLQLGKLSGTIKDLAGKSYSGSSSLASPSGTSYEGYGLVRMHGLDSSVVSQTYTRKNGTYMFPAYTGELEEGKAFDCYTIGDAEYRPGDTFTVSGTHDVYVQLKWKVFPVTFYNYDGTTELYSEDVTYNGSPSYPDDPAIAPAPAKPSTAQYEYAFTGWTTDGEDFYGKDNALPAVTEAVTYTAVFEESVRKYEITWIDGNGNTLKTEQVAYGQTPAYTGAEPTKSATTQYTYTFNNSWSPALAPVTGPAAYTARFDATVNKYTITWLNDDGSAIDTTQVEYGTVPAHADPAKEATAQYSYTFAGWSPALAEVTGEATYTAQFTPVLRSYTITWIIDGVETAET
ncbi:MAG: hypothetical protein IKW76_04650, partial [Clostridia bacterium]|nr:hypothetical protein [Clostridia bacterium]